MSLKFEIKEKVGAKLHGMYKNQLGPCDTDKNEKSGATLSPEERRCSSPPKGLACPCT